jgi:hypothetical protein
MAGLLVRADAESGRWKAIMFTGFAFLSVWLAGGAYSYYERTAVVVGDLLRSPPSADVTAELGLALLGVSLLVGWLFARHVVRSDPGRALLLGVAVPLALAAFVFVRPFMILRRLVPMYSHMRNPSWFMSVMPSLGLAIGVAGAWKALQKRFRLGRNASAGVAALVTVFLLADYLPYRRDLGDREPAPALPDLMEVLQAAPGPGRVLAREPYNPLSDFGMTAAGAANAWYWLNWASPKGIGHLVLEEIQPSLHKPESIHRALLLCGIANVRYVLYSLLEGPPPPSQEDLQPLKVTKSYLLFENRLARDYVQVYPLEAASLSLSEAVPVERREGVEASCRRLTAEKVELSVKVPEKAVAMVAESYFPGWQAMVNGRPTEVLSVFGTFLGVTVPAGQSDIQLMFRTPWYHRLSLFISVSAWLAAGVWIIGSAIRRALQRTRLV